MAYPSVTATYGFNPVTRLDGLPYAGTDRIIPIATNYATAIFHGDVVAINANGQLVKSGVTTDSTTSAANYTAGVFVGCSYTNQSTLQPLFYNFYQGGINAPDIAGIIVDDPWATFKVVSVNSAGAITAYGRAIVGANVAVNTTNAGNTLNGISGIAIDGSTAGVTAALPFRVIDVVPETGDGAGNYYEFIVKLNNHQYLNTTGV